MKKFYLVIILYFMLTNSFAQGCIGAFSANSGKTDITLKWTISANCTCTDVTLYWTTDSLFSNPIPIYSGTLSTFDHTTADMIKTNYYRLVDCNGNSSQTIAMRVGGLNYLFYPNPTNSSNNYMATVVFQNPYNSVYTLYLFDHNGQLMRQIDLIRGTTCQFSVEGFQPGLYLFVIGSTTTNVAAAGKFYVSNN